jgi:hypothetical protein
MSVVVGLAEGGKLYMAADRAVTYGTWQNKVPGIKLFRKGSVLFGGTGALKPVQVIKYQMKIPKTAKAVDPDTYIYKYLLPRLEEVFSDTPGIIEVNDSVIPCNLLIGYSGRFYRVGEDLSCIPLEHTYAAVGSGEGIATGVMAALDGVPPYERLTMAIDAVALHDPYVSSGDYDYLTL